jgi:hypothetical protein
VRRPKAQTGEQKERTQDGQGQNDVRQIRDSTVDDILQPPPRHRKINFHVFEFQPLGGEVAVRKRTAARTRMLG